MLLRTYLEKNSNMHHLNNTDYIDHLLDLNHPKMEIMLVLEYHYLEGLHYPKHRNLLQSLSNHLHLHYIHCKIDHILENQNQ